MTRITLALLAMSVAVSGLAFGQSPDLPFEPFRTDTAPTPGESSDAPERAADRSESGAAEGRASNAAGESGQRGNQPVSGNPAAVNIVTGTGKLGELLGLPKDSGVRLGGLWIGDANWLATGGLEPGQWSLNSLTLLNLTLDAEKLVGLEGGLFGIEFLQYTGQPTNQPAGVMQGYNSLDVTPPLVRQELYQLWWRQAFFDDRLIVRVGKTVPTYDFNNVARPAAPGDPVAGVPAVSGLIYTPLYVNPTLLGKIPGYYNSATGITTTVAPSKNFHVSYGFFDGNLATGEQTGLRGPRFNGYYFHIWEVGGFWRLGAQQKPGSAGVGIWDQTGRLAAANGALVDGAQGVYGFGAQRLWFCNPGIDNSGVSGFWQCGANNTNTSPVRQYFGAGLTGFGLVSGRPADSMGVGLAWSWLNTDPNAGQFFFPDGTPGPDRLRSNELMFQGYYQMFAREGVFLQPTLSYIPNPGQRPDIPKAWAVSLRLTLLF